MVKVNLAGKDVPGSPFPVSVQPDRRQPAPGQQPLAPTQQQPAQAGPGQPRGPGQQPSVPVQVLGLDTRKFIHCIELNNCKVSLKTF